MLQERLLAILERKTHWAWPHFAEGRIPLPRLKPHFQQEWEVYVRDFPILLARVLGHRPPHDVAGMLAANIYEEQTGGVSGAASHPELFLRMMEGCGYSRADFERVQLLPGARAYREFLDQASWGKPWVVGAAVLTIFVEGSANERAELAALERAPQTDDEIEASLRKHPLVRIHKLDPKFLELQRVHKKVEGGHRRDAWDAVLGNARGHEEAVASALERALELWLGYRDDVVQACGIAR
ncbi:MAG: iron-containing redox enzyme family protein [Myxococcales bacterium]|nr:iron-containing redox enzyme family protein [Myxococcales bacterium]